MKSQEIKGEIKNKGEIKIYKAAIQKVKAYFC